MNYLYKECTKLNHQLITQADQIINSDHYNPFELQPQEEGDEKDYNNYQETLPSAQNAFQSICDPNCFAPSKCLKTIYNLVKSKFFVLKDNQQFFDPQFTDGISRYLLSGQSDVVVEEAMLTIQILWREHPHFNSPLLDPSIVYKIFDVLSSPNIYLHCQVMKLLLVYFKITPQTKEFLLQNDIYIKLRDFLIVTNDPEYIETGLNLLYVLLKNEFEENWSEFLQFLPIFPKILENQSLDNRKKALWELSILIEDNRIFRYCQYYQLHLSIAKCCKNIIDQTLAYYLYKCVFAFAKRGYLKTFSNESIFNGMELILREERRDISPIFFTISLLIDNYSETLYKHEIYNPCIKYAREGCFENKISACYCISKFIIFTPEDSCDILAREVGLETLCDLIECFGSKDIIIPLRAFKRLIDLNKVLYCGLMLKCCVQDSLIKKYNEEAILMNENPQDDIYKEIVALLYFLNNTLAE